MTPYKRGTIVLLPFPYTDQSGSKRRPALILSTDAYNTRRADIIVAPITGNMSTGQADDTPLPGCFSSLLRNKTRRLERDRS
jgi:mRNA-degrading endonuclease toxin of MazEF toxin-antitoxin module